MALHAEAARSKRSISLAAFFKRLSADVDALERFASGGKERKAVIRASALSEAHKELLTRGCVRDVVTELYGSETAPNGAINTIINIPLYGTIDAACGHAECHEILNKLRE